MERLRGLLRKRWEVEAYDTATGKRLDANAPVPFATFWRRSSADLEARIMNSHAAIQYASHRYRVVPL